MTACPCPEQPQRTVTDPDRHTAWHQLVEQQTGQPAGHLAALRAARGITPVSLPTTTVLDDRAVTSGKRRAPTTTHADARAHEQDRARCRGTRAGRRCALPVAHPGPHQL